VSAEKSIPIDQERADTQPSCDCKGRLHFVHSLGIQDDDLLTDTDSCRLQVRRVCFSKEICWIREKADDDKAEIDRVTSGLEHDRDGRGRCFRSQGWIGGAGCEITVT
jgi:hypothetical protein